MTITQEMSRSLLDSTLSTIDALRAVQPEDSAWQALISLHEDRLRSQAAFAATPMPPCPPWCGLKAGHDWSGLSNDRDDTAMRDHERTFGRWYVAQDEFISPDGSFTRSPVFLSGGDASDDQFTLADARQLRDELTAAVDFLAGLGASA